MAARAGFFVKGVAAHSPVAFLLADAPLDWAVISPGVLNFGALPPEITGAGVFKTDEVEEVDGLPGVFFEGFSKAH